MRSYFDLGVLSFRMEKIRNPFVHFRRNLRKGVIFRILPVGLFLVAYNAEAGVDVYQPDLHIGKKRDLSQQIGDDVYDPKAGPQQRLGLKMLRRTRKVFFFVLENDGNAVDDLFLRAKPTPRKMEIRYFQTTGGRQNVTAKIVGTGFQIDGVAAADAIKFRVRAKYKSGKRIKKVVWVRYSANSVSDPAKRDSCVAIFVPHFTGLVP
jgi:hypothetical protein